MSADREPGQAAGLQRTVKDFAAEEQPREKAARFGCSALTLAELWSLVLRTGLPGKPVTDLCREMMEDSAGSLHNLERKTRKELMRAKGIGFTKAIQVEAVMEIVRRYNAETVGDAPCVLSSADIARYMRPKVGNAPREEMWAICLNRRNRIISSFRVSAGSAVATVFDLKGILKTALLENAEGLALVHNHPSGNLNPSPEDDRITRQCVQGCKTMQLRFLDHVVVTAHGHYSYADEGRLDL